MDFYSRAKRYSIERFTTSALSLLANASTENLVRLTYLAEKIPKKESYREKIRWIRTLFQTNHPGLAIARRVLNETHPHHRRKLISNFIVNQLLVGTNRRKAFETEEGILSAGFHVDQPDDAVQSELLWMLFRGLFPGRSSL